MTLVREAGSSEGRQEVKCGSCEAGADWEEGKKKAWEVIDSFFECIIQSQSVVKTSYRVFHRQF